MQVGKDVVAIVLSNNNFSKDGEHSEAATQRGESTEMNVADEDCSECRERGREQKSQSLTRTKTESL